MAVAPSVHTRHRFREHLVDTYLGYIDDVFQAAGLEPAEVPASRRHISGQRRYRVEQYYAGVDWSSPKAVSKVLRAYEQIMADCVDTDVRAGLDKQLRRDGFAVDADGRILAGTPLALGEIDKTSLVDPEAFRDYERRLWASVESDPELAIGTAKELVEAAAHLLLDDARIQPDTAWSLQQLFKRAAKTLDLTVDSVVEDKTGAEEIRKVLAGLSQVVIGTAELRNRFGTGHGRHRRASGLTQRHARLAAGCATTLVHFLLETRADHQGQQSRTAA